MAVTSTKKMVIYIVALALFMDALDATIINTAIPSMAHSLKVHPVDLKIALISYLVSLAIFIPISGWIGDKFGVKRVFIAALGIFTLSSLWCGYSHNLAELVISRSLQGVGGSLMLPLGRLIILRNFQRHQLVDAMNAVITVVSLGLMLGPLAGGVITDHISWSWIFWVNIPVGCFAMIIAFYWLKDLPPKKVRPLDVFGFLLFGVGLAGLTFTLSNLSESSANQTTTLTMMGISVFLLTSYFLRSSGQRHPIINTALFRMRTFKISIIGNLFARLGFGGVPFLLPLLLQVGLGYNAQSSGLLLVPLAVGILVVKSVSLRVLRMFGYRRLLFYNTFLVAASLWSFRLVNASTSVYLIAFFTFLFGLLVSMQYSGLNSLAYSDLTEDDQSSAASIMSTTQQIAQSFGVATGALLLRFYANMTPTHFELTPTVFHQAFFAMGILTFLSCFIFTRLKANDGHQMLSQPAQEKVSTS